MRKLAYDMDRLALSHEAKKLGKRLLNAERTAYDRLAQVKVPVLIIVGENDTPYILAAADYMLKNLPSANKIVIKDAAHLPNMDHPDQFDEIVNTFLEGLPR